jgi:nitrous oxidase accessory protein NosD
MQERRELMTIISRLVLAYPLTAVAIATQAATPIASCGYQITAAGTYALATDLGPCSSDGVDVRAGNVTLMLNGHTITGTLGASTMAGVAVTAVANAIIQGPGVVEQFGGSGVAFTNTSNSKLLGITTEYNVVGVAASNNTGLHLAGNVIARNSFQGINAANDSNDEIASNAVVVNNTNPGQLMPAILLAGNNNTLHDNQVAGSYIGILLNGTGNSVRFNSVFGALGAGIDVGGGTGNTIASNIAQGNGLTEGPQFDLYDSNGNCTANTWRNNTFLTASPACIR